MAEILLEQLKRLLLEGATELLEEGLDLLGKVLRGSATPEEVLVYLRKRQA